MGIFDPIINVDTKLFIDPTLLKKSQHPLIRYQAATQFKIFCENIFSLLEESKVKEDYAYRSAKSLIPKKEVVGTCLGYGTNSISGRSLSSKNLNTIIETAYEISKIGVKKPELFVLLPLFEKGIGADTISDITTAIIRPALFDFTAELARKFKIPLKKYMFSEKTIKIIQNPLLTKTSPVLLCPQDVLRKLPFASTWDDITDVSSFNHSLRTKVNRYISMVWKEKTKKAKHKKLAIIMKSKDGLNTMLDILNESQIVPYDFKQDVDQILTLRQIPELTSQYPLKLFKKETSENDLEKIVKTIIEQFKFLIEEKGQNTLLWKDNVIPNIENASQKLFFALAYGYCKANDIDINPEMDTGTGRVDFKFSVGFSKRVIVEIKHSYNPKIIDGFIMQLATYKKSEETCKGFYVIIDVGKLGKKYDKLCELYENDPVKLSEIVLINGNLKQPASKRTRKIKSKKYHFKNKGSIFDMQLEFPEITFELPDIEISDSSLEV